MTVTIAVVSNMSAAVKNWTSSSHVAGSDYFSHRYVLHLELRVNWKILIASAFLCGLSVKI